MWTTGCGQTSPFWAVQAATPLARLKRSLMWVAVLTMATGCQPGGGPTETWVIDFQTYASEVADTLSGLGLDQRLVENASIDALRDYFDGLPIEFVLGPERGLGESSICVRHGFAFKFGTGLVNLGNTHAVQDCGEPDGKPLGVFVNVLAEEIESQLAVLGSDARDRAELFGRILGVVLAHEIGHGVGLEHSTSDEGLGDIMKSTPVFDVSIEHYFSEFAAMQLNANLGG